MSDFGVPNLHVLFTDIFRQNYLSFGIINFRLAAGKFYHSWPSVKILMFVMFAVTIRIFKLFFCSDAYC